MKYLMIVLVKKINVRLENKKFKAELIEYVLNLISLISKRSSGTTILKLKLPFCKA